jgi:hypothetical protein
LIRIKEAGAAAFYCFSANSGCVLVATSVQAQKAAPAGSSSGFLAVWVLACAVAETGGLGVAGAWWILADRWNPEPMQTAAQVQMLIAKSLAGVGEGTILGLVQGFMLRRVYPRLRMAPFVLSTVLVAVSGWAAGSSASIFGNFESEAAAGEPPLWWILTAAAFFGFLAGGAFGAAQWVALRRAAQHATWWIWMNATGWSIALPVIYLAAGFDTGGNALVTAVTVLTAGLAAGACVGAATAVAIMAMRPAAP